MIHRRVFPFLAGLIVLAGVAGGCTEDKPVPRPAATGSGPPPATTAVSWRGASIPVGARWQAHSSTAEDLCLLPRTGTGDDGCLAKAQNMIFLYATERSGGAEGEPGHASSLTAAGMDSFSYDGGVVPCQVSAERRTSSVSRPLGGRTALAGTWQLTCAAGPSLLVQRWVLPQSRLGVLSYALTEADATAIAETIATVDLTGYRVTSPTAPTG
jgi:hypothetical protein